MERICNFRIRTITVKSFSKKILLFPALLLLSSTILMAQSESSIKPESELIGFFEGSASVKNTNIEYADNVISKTITLVLPKNENIFGINQVKKVLKGSFPDENVIFSNGISELGAGMYLIDAIEAGPENTRVSLSIVIFDLENPTLECPEDIVVYLKNGEMEVKVDYEAKSTDNVSSEIAYSIPPGTSFKEGIHSIKVQAYDPSGNVKTGSFHVIVKASETENPIHTKLEIRNELSVSPNPVMSGNEKLIFSFLSYETQEMSFQIIDESGKILLTQNFISENGRNERFVDLTNMKGGSYYLRLLDKENRVSQKLFVIH